MLTSIEICAGAGGQAYGLEKAGFEHQAVIEIDREACRTLVSNRPNWKVYEEDLWKAIEGRIGGFVPKDYKSIDLLAGGVPCPPFSVAGKQLGSKDERDLFPAALAMVDILRPKAVMLENVRGLLDAVFLDYREKLERQLRKLGYEPQWKLLLASDFGVPQLRPRVVVVAIEKQYADKLTLEDLPKVPAKTVGETLYDLMAERGWRHAPHWKNQANTIAPTLVGGSKKHGGPDLGPTRAKRAWATLGVDGNGIADMAPEPDFSGMPKLTVRMTSLLQGFDDKWKFVGGKTVTYRQVGNAFPPPVAEAVGRRIAKILKARRLFAVA